MIFACIFLYQQAGQSFDARQTDSEPQKVKDFIKDVVKAHNAYRKKHGKVRGSQYLLIMSQTTNCISTISLLNVKYRITNV